jgi:hypothetical protein
MSEDLTEKMALLIGMQQARIAALTGEIAELAADKGRRIEREAVLVAAVGHLIRWEGRCLCRGVALCIWCTARQAIGLPSISPDPSPLSPPDQAEGLRKLVDEKKNGLAF